MSNAISTSHRRKNPAITRLLDSIDRLNPDRLESLWESVDQQGVTPEEWIILNGVASESHVAKIYSDHYLVPLFDPPADAPPPIDTSVSSVLPVQMCRDHRIAPLSDNGGVLEIAVFSPDSLVLADEIKLLTGRQIRPLFAPLSVIDRLIKMLYDDGQANSRKLDSASLKHASVEKNAKFGKGSVSIDKAAETISVEPSSPAVCDDEIIRYVNGLLHQAISCGASDVHIEPYENDCRVRFRIDGLLTEAPSPPLQHLCGIVRRLKTLGKLDMTQCQLPQEGKIALRCGGNQFDLRTNICPTLFGDKVVMRVLDKNRLPDRLSELGMDRRQYQDLVESITRKQGMVLVTGPADSGKSSTLYACMNELNDNQTNLCAVEDPVDFRFSGINQVQANAAAGLTYANALQAFRRQDADVMLVGEIADDPTADACVQAAMAGHLVLSTLPTRDALSSITLLDDMGVDPFRLASSLRLLIAQRLVRRLCEDCKIPYRMSVETSRRYKIPREVPVFRAGRCKRCRNTGYKGRVAVFEVIRINHRLINMIQARESIDAMKIAAYEDGMSPMSQSIRYKLADGLTSIEEVSHL